LFDWQARYEKELAEETERNKDDIAHLEALEKHYVERGKAYEVRHFFFVETLEPNDYTGS